MGLGVDDPLVDSEDPGTVRVLGSAGMVLDHDDYVLQDLEHPPGQPLEGPINKCFERSEVHPSRIRPVAWWDA